MGGEGRRTDRDCDPLIGHERAGPGRVNSTDSEPQFETQFESQMRIPFDPFSSTLPPPSLSLSLAAYIWGMPTFIFIQQKCQCTERVVDRDGERQREGAKG